MSPFCSKRAPRQFCSAWCSPGSSVSSEPELRAFPQADELRLAGVIFDAIVVGDDVDGTVGGNAHAFDLLLQPTFRRLQIWNEIARERLAQHRERAALHGWRHSCDRDRIE